MTIEDAAILRLLPYSCTRGARKYVTFICTDDQCKSHAYDSRLRFALVLGKHTRSSRGLEATARALERRSPRRTSVDYIRRAKDPTHIRQAHVPWLQRGTVSRQAPPR